MFDPVTISAAVATASTAFSGIKRAFQAGRDLESMTQDLSRWMGAVSDVDAAHKSAKNPTMFRKVFGGGTVEQEALEAFAAKKKLEEQRYELQQFIKFSHGTAAWDELLRMEGQIRKRRQQEIYDKRYLEKRLLVLLHLPLCLLLAWLFWVFSFTPSWDSTEDGGYRTRDKCVRKQGGQETFEWLCTDGYVIYLAQSENIIQCFSCFLKKFSDWTWEQEIRRGVREDPKYITCRRYKRKTAKKWSTRLFI